MENVSNVLWQSGQKSNKRYYDQNNIVVRDMVAKDVDFFKHRLKKIDIIEMKRSHNITPEEGLRLSFKQSMIAITVTDGWPIICSGINPLSILGDKAILWLLSTERIKDINIRFVKNCRKFINHFLEFYPNLFNYIDVENTITLKWIKFLGAEIDEAKPYGYEQKPFHRFTFRRSYAQSLT